MHLEEIHKMYVILDNGRKGNMLILPESEGAVLDGDENKRKYDVMNRMYINDTRPHQEHDYQTPHQN